MWARMNIIRGSHSRWRVCNGIAGGVLLYFEPGVEIVLVIGYLHFACIIQLSLWFFGSESDGIDWT